MPSLIMKSMTGAVHYFVGNIFVVGLHDLTNDETTVQFVVTKDNK